MDWNWLKKQKRPIVLYGMGNGADRILAKLDSIGLKADGVFANDDFARHQTFHGFEVLRYDEAKEKFPQMLVLLAFGTNRPEVLARIAEISREQTLFAPDFPVVDGPAFDAEFCRLHEAELAKTRSLLADSQSVKVFDEVLSYKKTGDISHLSACETSPEEAYRNILQLSAQEDYCDLGAYRGDTIREFLHYAGGCRSITAIEPDSYTFRHLVENTKDLENCRCLNLAVSDCTGEIAFAQRGGRNSCVDKGGKTIPCDSVDHIFDGECCSFLNMDVEGQEAAAIRGAAETIRCWKPKLLIAAYHRNEDLFALPQQVLAIRSDYRVFMRHYPQIPAWDTNFYFV